MRSYHARGRDDVPTKPLRPCSYPGCRALVAAGRCPQHASPRRQASASYQHLYNSERWRRARRAFLRDHPLCAECGRGGRTTLATVVDHVVPHRGDPERFWDESNWQPLCTRCHNVKTATRDHGFGNA